VTHQGRGIDWLLRVEAGVLLNVLLFPGQPHHHGSNANGEEVVLRKFHRGLCSSSNVRFKKLKCTRSYICVPEREPMGGVVCTW
jgi:hypothetical protein